MAAIVTDTDAAVSAAPTPSVQHEVTREPAAKAGTGREVSLQFRANDFNSQPHTLDISMDEDLGELGAESVMSRLCLPALDRELAVIADDSVRAHARREVVLEVNDMLESGRTDEPSGRTIELFSHTIVINVGGGGGDAMGGSISRHRSEPSADGPHAQREEQPTSATVPNVTSPHLNSSSPPYWFKSADARWITHLEQEGYVVVKAAASAQDVAIAKRFIQDDLASAYGVARSEPETWKQSDWRLPVHGLCAELAQTAGPWHIRGLPRVKDAFAKIWGETDLISSMDAVIIWRPWWAAPEGEQWRPRTEGLHLDQNPFHKPHKECIQGMVPLIDVTEEVGGLQVVPRSHTDESKQVFRERYPVFRHCGDWCVMPKNLGGEPPLLLLAEKGDLVLWDSRTIHGGKVGSGMDATTEAATAAEQGLDLARMTCTVAMTPRAWATEEVKQARRDGFEAGCSFNHCPHEAGSSSGTIQAKLHKGFKKVTLSPNQLAVL